MYFVYILECVDKSLYTGITTDLKRRFLEHSQGKGGNYTRAHKVKKIVYSEEVANRSLALKRECEIKSFSVEKKLEIINSNL